MTASKDRDELQCRTCQHFLTIPGLNGERDQYFCNSMDTKVGPAHVGWLRWDAPACRFHSRIEAMSSPYAQMPQSVVAKKEEAQKPVVYVLTPPASGSTHDRVIRIAGIIALILSLTSWIGSDAARIAEELRPIWVLVSSPWSSPKPTIVLRSIPSARVMEYGSHDAPEQSPSTTDPNQSISGEEQ